MDQKIHDLSNLPVLARHEDIDDGVDASGQVDEDVAGQGQKVQGRVVEHLDSHGGSWLCGDQDS